MNDLIDLKNDIIDFKNDIIDWDTIKNLVDTTTKNSEFKKLTCKKCDIIFYSRNYNGEFPLCIKHRTNITFKKK